MSKYLAVTLALGAAFSAAGCKKREFNSGAEIKADLESTSNGLPFNALKVIEDPKTAPITAYPKNFGKPGVNIIKPDGNGLLSVASDQVFFSSMKDWFGSTTVEVNKVKKTFEYQLQATPTTYVTVTDDDENDGQGGGVLTYKLDGRTLEIKVSEVQDTEMNHTDAINACASKQLRLPTARELFDFCFAGREKPANPAPMNPLNTRCTFRYNWTTTLKADNREHAWAAGNWITWHDRRNILPFRCVGRK
ncbi:MAG: hypothetical protein EBR09_02090 [Proteobacteria bacterium]|nr:hypothetical protein [Pseudomonadota bacterium]